MNISTLLVDRCIEKKLSIAVRTTEFPHVYINGKIGIVIKQKHVNQFCEVKIWSAENSDYKALLS